MSRSPNLQIKNQLRRKRDDAWRDRMFWREKYENATDDISRATFQRGIDDANRREAEALVKLNAFYKEKKG